LSSYRLEIRVTPRPGLLDPEGAAIQHALGSLGFHAVTDVRVGKAIYVDASAVSEGAALELGEAMCRRLLANPVTEDFEVSLHQPTGAEAS
jgi:phosphoribosylformylglycinamidine synthase